MEIRFTDADGFDRHAAHADLAVLVVQREDIEGLRVGSIVERLLMLSDSRAHAQRFAGRVLLQVGGYDDDPRPLAQIPECVRFFRAVDGQWNYWLHFLVPDPDHLMFIVLMLVDVEVRATHLEMVGYALRDPEQLNKVLERLLGAMRRLQMAHDMPLTHAMAVAAAVARAFGSSDAGKG